MFGPILLYLHNVLLVNHLHLPFAQVGTNCGLVGQNACVEVDGAAYWMSENGFFRYAGKLESLACLVEDHVYNDINLESGNQMVSAGLNNLFGEVIWFYPSFYIISGK